MCLSTCYLVAIREHSRGMLWFSREHYMKCYNDIFCMHRVTEMMFHSTIEQAENYSEDFTCGDMEIL